MRPAGRIRLPIGRVLPSLLVATAGACSSPSAVVVPPLEVVVASGDSQYGTMGQTVGLPLRVVVRTLSGKVPTPNVDVSWEIASGDAAVEGLARTVTDSTGSTEVTVRLGSSIGPVAVAATAEGPNRPSTEFALHVVERPVLDAVEPATAAPGELVTLTGRNFSPVAEQSVVLFSGVRGMVVDASETSLTVEVPPCLPARAVAVSVQLGIVASETRPLGVGAGGQVLAPAVGDVVDVSADEVYACLPLAGDGARYLVLPFTVSTVGAASHPYRLTGLSSAESGPTAQAHPVVRPRSPAATPDPQGRLDHRLRELEAELGESAALQAPAAAHLAAPPARAVPTVGTRRTFNVFRGDGDFAQVSAVARHVGGQVALFVDEGAPAGGFSPADLQLFADRFDEVIHPVVTGAYGSTSDLDANQRVIVLFSPVVNELTPRGSSGFVGGFFYGIDLLRERQGSNAGEIFYALVPDPAGVHSDPRPTDQVLQVTPAILAHEFQHMVHFNERFLVRGAGSAEAVWLSEGLAQFAEELVARRYLSLGDAASADLFRSGTRTRARRYLARPDTVSLIISAGQGSLAERGASYLFVAYLEDQLGPDLPGALTRSTRTGVDNVEAGSGWAWASLLADWWSAVWLDGPGSESGPLVYPDVDVRAFVGNPFPLEPVALGAGDFHRAGSLWSSSAAYYIVVPPAGGVTALRLGGEAGGPSAPQAGLRLRIVRIS